MATNERSLLTVLFPARELRTTLVPSLRTAVAALLASLGVPEVTLRQELSAMDTFAFGVATNRRVLGSMNDLAFQASVHLAHGDDLAAIALRLAETPMSAIGPTRSQLGFPRDVARELLDVGTCMA